MDDTAIIWIGRLADLWPTIYKDISFILPKSMLKIAQIAQVVTFFNKKVIFYESNNFYLLFFYVNLFSTVSILIFETLVSNLH